LDKPDPARNLLWLDHVSTLGRVPGNLRGLIGWPSRSGSQQAPPRVQRDLLLPRAQRLTGERSALSPTL
jgi:hypothetical protein